MYTIERMRRGGVGETRLHLGAQYFDVLSYSTSTGSKKNGTAEVKVATYATEHLSDPIQARAQIATINVLLYS